jgi:alpha-amylase/alpha-mannosidase (GH57 family)
MDLLLKLVFLWHQHQPYYKNLLTGEYLLPWVRLHGIKDYLDMVEILQGYPSVKQVFNMVPSLLEQIKDYANDSAVDPHLGLSRKNASDLTPEDKTEMLKLLFQANYDNLIAPFRKYKSLYHTREKALAEWTEDDWRDLQCVANLAWIDPLFRKKGRLKVLAEKGERYTEEDKQEILTAQREIIRRIIPTLRDYMEAGQIEVSTSPYFHPIMPLLYDTDTALKAMPNAPMPEDRFQHPEDVDKQVEMAVNQYHRFFGRSPVGMWPSEGSVSEDILPILQKYGIKWIATDEEILSESSSVPSRAASGVSLVSSGELYRPYKFKKAQTEMAIFFRDHAISDNIGFVYSGWTAERAANDFMSRLKAIHENLQKRKVPDPVVSIVLDGENAWEYYKNDGHEFLNALYTKISEQSWIETTTYREIVLSKTKFGGLKKLFPGSWINHNFSVWIGHKEDNKAWDLLSKVRNELIEFQKENPEFDKNRLKSAWREIYISEGSDWCWWFGDDHVGPHNDEFDSLYRTHLANVYHLTDREPPEELFVPVRSSFFLAHISKPINYITPQIDGYQTHFYEWNQAGFFDCMKAGSTMHRSENILRGIWFGYDTENLYLMMRGAITVTPERFRNTTFEIEFQAPAKGHLKIEKREASLELNGASLLGFEFALDQLLEIAVPLRYFPLDDENDKIYLRIFIKMDSETVESWPPADSLIIPIPREGSSEIPWII